MEDARIGASFEPMTSFGGWWRCARACVEILAILLIFCAIPASAADTNEKNVLILFGYSAPVVPSSYTHLIESEVRAQVPNQVNFYLEYMEGTRVDDQEYLASFAASLRDTYAGHKLDLIMVSTSPALNFILKYRDSLFPGVPIVYFSQDTRRIQGRRWPGVTGVTETQNVKAVIDMALRLHPGTNTIAVVTGTSAIEKFWLNVLHSELLHEKGVVREIDLVGLPIKEVLERTRQLPTKTVFFLSSLHESQFSRR